MFVLFHQINTFYCFLRIEGNFAHLNKRLNQIVTIALNLLVLWSICGSSTLGLSSNWRQTCATRKCPRKENVVILTSLCTINFSASSCEYCSQELILGNKRFFLVPLPSVLPKAYFHRVITLNGIND